MELHSYAKHRTAKKWSLEQKRRLVEARINCDNIFQSKPKTSLLPWKTVIFQAKLDDFNIVFVRKQWEIMITKYMQYKHARLGNKPTHDIDAETIKKITQKWEFFEPIHRYMTRKTTNLHSYALTTSQQHGLVGAKKLTNNSSAALKQNSASSNEHLNACSSDTNDATFVPNTDHDFYSKRAEQQQFYFTDIEEDSLESIQTETVTTWMVNNVADTPTNIQQDYQRAEQQKFYFADVEEDTLESIKTETVTTWTINGTDTTMPNAQEFQTTSIERIDVKEEEQSKEKHAAQKKVLFKKHAKTKILSEREKYYRHKRRYHHRMERRFDALLNVIGQVAKSVCPSVDINQLLQTGGDVMNSFLTSSSCSSSENENENDHKNKS